MSAFIDAEVPPEVETSELRRVARGLGDVARAKYPGPAGELIARELYVWSDFGFRFDRSCIIAKLIKELSEWAAVEKAKIPV